MERPFDTKIFLDSGDPDETRKALSILGFLDGQTTNPSLVAKNPEIQAQVAESGGFTEQQLLGGYRDIIREIAGLVPEGALSIEVYADAETTSKQMLEQARDFATWIPAPYIKLPITVAGLAAGEILAREGINLNFTLCFSQEQALAVHYATMGAKPGQVFVSPFIGRLDDFVDHREDTSDIPSMGKHGVCGISLIETIVRHYRERTSHVKVLAASIRSLDHIYGCIEKGADIMTIPFKYFGAWQESGFGVPDDFGYTCGAKGLEIVEYKKSDETAWQDFDIQHTLTDQGIAQFSRDWNDLLRKES